MFTISGWLPSVVHQECYLYQSSRQAVAARSVDLELKRSYLDRLGRGDNPMATLRRTWA